MDTNLPSLLIVGSGAMACLFAARLAAAGVRFAMLGSWKEGLEALRSRGVQVVDAQGIQQAAYPVTVTSRPQDVRGVQYALVLVKSWQTERAAHQLAECLHPDGLALTLQNGLGNYEILAEQLGSRRVALGVTTLGASLVAPGVVRPAGDGTISMATLPPDSQASSQPLALLLRQAGFNVENTANSRALLWSKLVINSAINPLTALLSVSNGELLQRRTTHDLLAAAARETAAVAAAQGIALPYPDPVEIAEIVARRTAENRSSMLQDVQRGAPTEIDAICGAVVRAGEQYGISTPVNRILWQMVKALPKNGKNGNKEWKNETCHNPG